MSREERRQYQRMMKNVDRAPALPASARARAERAAARRARRAETASAGGIGRRFWIRAIAIALGAGFLAFSLQWGSGMPAAVYAGLAVAAVTLAIVIGLRLLLRRASAAGNRGAP